MSPTKHQAKVSLCMEVLMEKWILNCQWAVSTVFHCYPQTSRGKTTSHNRYTTRHPTPWPQEKLTLIACMASGVVEALTGSTLYCCVGWSTRARHVMVLPSGLPPLSWDSRNVLVGLHLSTQQMSWDTP